MRKNTEQFHITDPNDFKNKMLNWLSGFNIFCFLDTCGYTDKYKSFEFIAAAGEKDSVTLTACEAFSQLKAFYDRQPGWLFGHLGYNAGRPGTDHGKDNFGDGFFFIPTIIIQFTDRVLSIETEGDPLEIYRAIMSVKVPVKLSTAHVNIRQRLSEKDYIETIGKILAHIKRGDCYELNFCQEFYNDNCDIDPLSVYQMLQQVSPNPFAAFYRVNNNYCMCASPERYLRKEGEWLLSQPIKGTSSRSTDPVQDEINKNYLKQSAKERSENVMIVDLVRNDLSKVCKEGSVEVEELFGIYSFPQVHQMISTIKGKFSDDKHWTEALSATFPMGSMTGAPKIRVMELINKYEKTERGLFSGSIGYIKPDGDFDFNVIIRSMFYNVRTKYLSYFTGGGITSNSDPVLELNECMLKAEAIKKVLN